MTDSKIQNCREPEPHAGSSKSSRDVLDFCHQIPAKLRVYLEDHGLSTSEQWFQFLQPKLSSLENPYKINNCEKASERLWNAWVNQESVLIYGDYDLDGTSGIILLYDSFKALGFQNLRYFQPSKANDGYGLHAAVLEKLNQENHIDVVVTVDVGITGHDACLKAKELGIDVIITDHHLAQETLPEAYAIVNPNQPGDESGLGYLCGCGVGFYLVRGLCKKWIEKGSAVKLDLKSILPYFAIATVTDMVPLVKDNRTLLKFAFESFKNVTNFGLKALMKELNLLGRKLDSNDIGLQLAPKINAISRMSATLKPIDLLFQTNEISAQTFAKDILKLNDERKRLQEIGLQEVKQAYEVSEPSRDSETAVLSHEHRVFFYSSPRIHHGITGLVASKMVEQYGGSFFIGALSVETGVVVGSSRKSDKIGYSLVDMMAHSKDKWIRFGGHASAAGFEYVHENQEHLVAGSQQFLSRLNSHAFADSAVTDMNEETNTSANMNANVVAKGRNCVDLEWFDLNDHFYSWVQFMEPFGVQFPEPVFQIKNASVFSIKKMKEKHFKLHVVNPQNRESLSFVLFNASDEQRKLLTSLHRDFHIRFKIKRDHFNHNQRFQFIVDDIQMVNS
ncbi:MAG: DHH family phosphoesterase [Bdellovibrionaceae bacterium]|nr:DHH family phosphoesterase [Pseudobdellovibrionaceae bacterium]